MNFERSLHELLKNYFEQCGVEFVVINNETIFDKQQAINVLISSIDETIKMGDIEGKTVNLQAYMRYIKANIIGAKLFVNPREIEFECESNLSFAVTSVVCDSFGFDVDSPKQQEQGNNKENFQKFYDLIDYLHVTSGPTMKDIIVTFTVNNVWEE